MTGIHDREWGVRALKEAFASGARTVALRGWTGNGVGRAALAFAADHAAGGKVLVVAPNVIHAQVRRDIEALAPDLRVGNWADPDASVELSSSWRAGRNAERRDGAAFDVILVEEHHATARDGLRKVREQFPDVPVVEIVRMPHPHRGALEADVDIGFPARAA